MPSLKSPEFAESFVAIWQPTIKYLFFVQGGALVAQLALIGNVVTSNLDISSDFMGLLRNSAENWCLALFATILGSVFVSFYADLMLSDDQALSQKVIRRAEFVISLFAVGLLVASVIFSYFGVERFLDAIQNLSGKL